MDPLEFRLKNYAEVEPISGKPFSSKALARVLRAGCGALGWSAQARAAPDADASGLLVGWGVGTAVFRPHVPGPVRVRAARGRPRRGRTGGATTWARAPGPRWRRSLPTVWARYRAARFSHRHVRSAGRRHRRRIGPHGDGRGGDPQCGRRRDLAAGRTGHGRRRSPLFGAGNAGVIARDGHLFRRDDESRGESYADILSGPASPHAIEGHGQTTADAAAREHYAMYAHGAVFAEVMVDPALDRSASRRSRRRFRGGSRHQPAAGAKPVFRRDDLGVSSPCTRRR